MSFRKFGTFNRINNENRADIGTYPHTPQDITHPKQGGTYPQQGEIQNTYDPTARNFAQLHTNGNAAAPTPKSTNRNAPAPTQAQSQKNSHDDEQRVRFEYSLTPGAPLDAEKRHRTISRIAYLPQNSVSNVKNETSTTITAQNSPSTSQNPLGAKAPSSPQADAKTPQKPKSEILNPPPFSALDYRLRHRRLSAEIDKRKTD